eukprot:366510-Chlamydomonas_euryale.AAC.2
MHEGVLVAVAATAARFRVQQGWEPVRRRVVLNADGNHVGYAIGFEQRSKHGRILSWIQSRRAATSPPITRPHILMHIPFERSSTVYEKGEALSVDVARPYPTSPAVGWGLAGGRPLPAPRLLHAALAVFL